MGTLMDGRADKDCSQRAQLSKQRRRTNSGDGPRMEFSAPTGVALGGESLRLERQPVRMILLVQRLPFSASFSLA
jgi:hypothetical protein